MKTAHEIIAQKRIEYDAEIGKQQAFLYQLQGARAALDDIEASLAEEGKGNDAADAAASAVSQQGV
jgi:hypothetical protein